MMIFRIWVYLKKSFMTLYAQNVDLGDRETSTIDFCPPQKVSTNSSILESEISEGMKARIR